MPDKKLTDSEITIKALEGMIQFAEMVDRDVIDMVDVQTLKNTLDLINRLQAKLEKCEKVEHFADKTIATLQAENERLSTLAELGDMRANDYRTMRDRALKAEAEIERLKAKQEKCFYCTEQANKKISEIKAEAYKEFAERLEAEYTDFDEENEVILPENLNKAINDLLKELVGEDNG